MQDQLLKRAEKRAERLMLRAAELSTNQERSRHERLARLVSDRHGIGFTTRLLDRSFRPKSPERVAALIEHELQSTPGFFGPVERGLLAAFRRGWKIAPKLAVAAFVRRLRAETAHLVLDAKPSSIEAHLRRRDEAGVQVNLNVIGEAVLSAAEAERRLKQILAALALPNLTAVSVKISAIRAQIHPLAHEAVVADATRSIARLCEAAGDTMIALDMEEFHDLSPTVEVYTRLAKDARFQQRTDAIALQAYIPDSLPALEQIIELGKRRRARGSAPLRVRLVKGANLAMERLDAAIHGWNQAPFGSKGEVDAQMKRMLGLALRKENADAVHVGLGSHNVFEIAWALTLAEEHGTTDALTVEMLQGMAEPLLRAVREELPRVLCYTPAATKDEFLAAIAYLTRRLDENSTKENFLRHAFSMKVGDRIWIDQRERFRTSVSDASSPPIGSRRDEPQPVSTWDGFANAPDTDFTRDEVRLLVEQALAQGPLEPAPPDAELADVDRCVEEALKDSEGWGTRSHSKRREVLRRAAEVLAGRRVELLSLMAREAHKTAAQADGEFSEAVDFLNYYAGSLDPLLEQGVRLWPRGVVAVVSPWNFPLAIPLGGVASALIGGNRVVLKPSPHTVRIALAGCEALWAAGVPKSALMLLPAEAPVAARLTAHEDMDAVVFTGSTRTAGRILEGNPGGLLLAETGGKNATIVTATADRDLAIKSVVYSAFGHSGQKCSATSLLVLEDELFDDSGFQRRLIEATKTLRSSAATDPACDVPPLVQDPNDALASVYRQLPSGHRWALEPERLGERHYTPGIVWGVEPKSPMHLRELFGPVLGVMRARDLPHAIALVNETGFGLTAGLQSLDELEWLHFAQHVRAGNLYINRPTVGAVVERQPFGGWGKSGFGPGAKAGGVNYAAQLCRLASSLEDITYDAAFARQVTETQRIHGQANLFRYRPAPRVVLRVEGGDDPLVVRARRAAAVAAGCHVDLSSAAEESLATLCNRMSEIDRVILCRENAPPSLLDSASTSWTYVHRDPVTGTSRDLLPFLVEQTISVDVHRYGWVSPDARSFAETLQAVAFTAAP